MRFPVGSMERNNEKIDVGEREVCVDVQFWSSYDPMRDDSKLIPIS